MLLRRSLRPAVLTSLLAVPMLFAFGAPADAGSSEPMPPMSPSRIPDFSAPTRIDNRFSPMPVGTEWRYEGSVTEEGERTPHQVVFTVSSLTKVINGVETRVVWDRDFADGVLEEAELAFFAQDDGGTVWNFGEYPEEYDEGKFDDAPDVWITGSAGARGGVHMLGDPDVGDAYIQGLVPRIEFLDVGEVAASGLRNCVPVGCFRHVLLVEETSPLDPEGGIQTKYWAPGTGLVRIGAIGGDSQERMTLRSLRVLRGHALDAVDDEVRRLDRRGNRLSEFYPRTSTVQ